MGWWKTEEHRDAHWNEYAKERLVGKTIKSVGYLTKKEASKLGWDERCLVIEFDDGSYVFPSRDDEGNGGGALFGGTKDGDEWTFPVL